MDWWMWLAGGLVLLVIELATPSGFFVMFFGLGVLTAGVLTSLGVIEAPWIQWLVFIVTSVAYLLLFRGQLQRQFDRQPGLVDPLIGEIAIPRERIEPGAVGRL